MAPQQLPSRSQIDKAGAYLAAGHGLRPGSPEQAEWYDASKIAAAFSIVTAFRAAHQRPLSIVTVGLRQFIGSETGAFPVVSQRLKREQRIVRKLHRMGSSRLSALEDIGGCRGVIESPAELERVATHLRRTWEGAISRSRDYIADPQTTGYRALHFTIRKGDRSIEVQLRTRGQQDWANAIEAADSRHGLTLKDGSGPISMLEYFAVGGEVVYRSEYGLPLDSDLRQRMTSATDRVVQAGYYSPRT